MTDHALDSHDHAHHHDESSIFPWICGTGAGLFLFGTAANWNSIPWGMGLLLIGLAILIGGMIGWWVELIKANKSDETTLIGTVAEVQRILRVGFAFFIGSEVMFFAAFFAYYFYVRFHSPVWPPLGYERLPLGPALVNTALLVSSGFLFHFAEHSLVHAKELKNAKGRVVTLLTLAVTLGAIFLGVQANEWITLMHEGFSVVDGTFGTAFYLLTGFHGFHVIIGAIFLSVVLGRVTRNHFTAKKHFAMTAAGWYWHFVDVVWIGLVLALYVF